MSLIPVASIPVITSGIVSAGCIGIASIPLGIAVANGLFQYSQAGITVLTNDIGLAGIGIGTGTCTLPPGILNANMASLFASALLLGPVTQLLANELATAITVCINTSVVTTANPTVAEGSGVGTVVPMSGIPYFIEAFDSMSISGITGKVLATAIATAIDLSLPYATANVIISGVSSPTVVTGFGIGKIF